jgi:hypothetical protein
MADIEARYHDPRTGERITEETYKQRYGLAAFLSVRHLAHGVAAEVPGLPPYGARCPDCGTSVATEGELCALCGEKRAAKAVPQFVRVLAPQPEPAYVKTAREAAIASRIAVDDEAHAAGDVLGGATSGDGA